MPAKRLLKPALVLLFIIAAPVAWRVLQTRFDPPAPVGPAVDVTVRLGESIPVPDDERRWGRAEIGWDPEHYPPNRSDWSDEPARWELRRVVDVPGIPQGVRAELGRLDCAIPKRRAAIVDAWMIWGEFERAGQRDLAVLCVHSDQSSSTYVFWGGEASRRETMPESGNSISIANRARIESYLDLEKPLEPDMPAVVTHDGLEIGCCECCSTIFYRHEGRWFTLGGAD